MLMRNRDNSDGKTVQFRPAAQGGRKQGERAETMRVTQNLQYPQDIADLFKLVRWNLAEFERAERNHAIAWIGLSLIWLAFAMVGFPSMLVAFTWVLFSAMATATLSVSALATATLIGDLAFVISMMSVGGWFVGTFYCIIEIIRHGEFKNRLQPFVDDPRIDFIMQLMETVQSRQSGALALRRARMRVDEGMVTDEQDIEAVTEAETAFLRADGDIRAQLRYLRRLIEEEGDIGTQLLDPDALVDAIGNHADRSREIAKVQREAGVRVRQQLAAMREVEGVGRRS